MDPIAQVVAGLGMIAGLIVIVLGLALSHNSYGVDAWLMTGRKISLLGSVILSISAIAYGVIL